MAKVSISEAARLVEVSRPTIYKMLNTGKLSYTTIVKQGRESKVVDTSELIRVFGSLKGDVNDTPLNVNVDNEFTGVNSQTLQDLQGLQQQLQHQIALLEAENDGLKEAVKARDEHIDSLRQAMLLLEHKQAKEEQPVTPEPSPIVRKKKWWPWGK